MQGLTIAGETGRTVALQRAAGRTLEHPRDETPAGD